MTRDELHETISDDKKCLGVRCEEFGKCNTEIGNREPDRTGRKEQCYETVY